MKLVHSTPAQQQAAFKVVMPEIRALVLQYVPWMFQQQAMTALEQPANQQRILHIIDEALDAAENVTGASS